jgi:hypothetical protein
MCVTQPLILTMVLTVSLVFWEELGQQFIETFNFLGVVLMKSCLTFRLP